MGFHATDTLVRRPQTLPGRSRLSSNRRQVQVATPTKNRVWDFFATFSTSVWKFVTQPVEPHRETFATSTIIVSDVRLYGFRYYSPTLGRWLNRDPSEERGGLNVYASFFNNPIRFVDRTGRDNIGGGGENSPPDRLPVPPAPPTTPPPSFGRDGTHYGHYCGAGTRPQNYSGDPIDLVDAACQSHDNCYDQNKIPSWDSKPEKTCGKRKCDTALVNSLSFVKNSVMVSDAGRHYAEDAIALFSTLGGGQPPSQWEKCNCKEYNPGIQSR